MSGFSALTAGLSSGLGKGLMGYEQGKDDQLKYETLMQQKQQAEETHNKNLDVLDQQLKLNDYKLNSLRDNMLRQSVDITKQNVAKTFGNIIDTYSKHQGQLAKVDPETGKKLYNIPEDLSDSFKDLNNQLVHNPQGSDWINHYMDSQYGTMNNPIVNVAYEPQSDQIVMTQKDGNDIKMSPLLMNHALGLDKYSTIYDQKKLTQLAQESVAKYKEHKATIDEINSQAKLVTAQNTAKKIESDIKLNKEKVNTEKIKAEAALAKLKKKSLTKDEINANMQQVNESAYELLKNPNVTKKDVQPIVDKLASNKAYTDSLVKNQGTLYRKVNALKYFRDKSGELSKELNSLADGAKTGTFETVNKMFIRYTGKGLNKEEYLKANTLSTRINLMVMDYLQYKSGAAFGAEELKGYQSAGGVLDFNSPDVAKASIQGMHTYLADKLKKNIDAVPTASDRLLLSYNAGYFDEPKAQPTTNPVTSKLDSLPDDNARVEYLRKLKTEDPKQYEEFVKTYGGK